MNERTKLLEYLKQQNEDVDNHTISKDTGIPVEQLMDLEEKLSYEWMDISKGVFTRILFRGDTKEMQEFYKRDDVNLCLLCMERITDIKSRMKKRGAIGHTVLIDQWILNRGW